MSERWPHVWKHRYCTLCGVWRGNYEARRSCPGAPTTQQERNRVVALSRGGLSDGSS